jgi:hypothetical protein
MYELLIDSLAYKLRMIINSFNKIKKTSNELTKTIDDFLNNEYEKSKPKPNTINNKNIPHNTNASDLVVEETAPLTTNNNTAYDNATKFLDKLYKLYTYKYLLDYIEKTFTLVRRVPDNQCYNDLIQLCNNIKKFDRKFNIFDETEEKYVLDPEVDNVDSIKKQAGSSWINMNNNTAVHTNNPNKATDVENLKTAIGKLNIYINNIKLVLKFKLCLTDDIHTKLKSISTPTNSIPRTIKRLYNNKSGYYHPNNVALLRNTHNKIAEAHKSNSVNPKTLHDNLASIVTSRGVIIDELGAFIGIKYEDMYGKLKGLFTDDSHSSKTLLDIMIKNIFKDALLVAEIKKSDSYKKLLKIIEDIQNIRTYNKYDNSIVKFNN